MSQDNMLAELQNSANEADFEKDYELYYDTLEDNYNAIEDSLDLEKAYEMHSDSAYYDTPSEEKVKEFWNMC